MIKVTIFIVVLAFVYCAEAQRNPFNIFGMDPYVMHDNIMKQMRSMVDPNKLKNQAGDGKMVYSSASMIDGKYKVVLAEKKDGVYSVDRIEGPQ